MNGQFELRSPVDLARLKVVIGDQEALPLREPLTDGDYEAVAEVLAEHPDVILSVGGFDTELTRLEFLRWFPKLRRVSLGLHHLDGVAGLNSLPGKLEFLNLGETKKSLDLRPLTFTQLRQLRVDSHNKGLPELLGANKQLQALALRGIRADQALSNVELQQLESLSLTLGSLNDPRCLAMFPNLRFVALRQVRGLAGLDVLRELPKLEWLWLDTLAGITTMPNLKHNNRFLRADLNALKDMRDDDALDGLAAAPHLDEVEITSSQLAAAAFGPLAKHPLLTCINVGTGNARRNKEIEALFDKPKPRSIWRYAEDRGIQLLI